MLKIKKIGIISLFGYHNYGNRLQMFAVQKVFKTLNFDSEIIKYELRTAKDPIFIQFKVFVHYLLNLRPNLSKAWLFSKRISNFKKHAKEHYCESRKYVNPLRIDKAYHEKYDFFSVGSDQIWGWFTYPIASFVFLQFAPKEKRIAFSPSFGNSTIDGKYKKIFSQGLEGFSDLSVREVSGAKIIQDFTGKEATVLCDPTMCVSKIEWFKFSTAHRKKPNRKFVLTYFLGEKSPKVTGVLENLSEEYEIINLNSLEAPQYYTINPSEWVDYINSASLFLTDSFHGIVFSIIMQTPFAVYSRVGGENMQTRISNILEKFSMEDRFEMRSDDSYLFNMDFTESEAVIENEKLRVYAFLRNSLSI